MAAAPLSSSSSGRLKSVCEAIWQIEDKLGLLDDEVAGVFYWRLIRWEACRSLIRQSSASPGTAPRSLSYRIGHEIGALRRSLRFPNWTKAGPVDTVVVPFPRKHRRDGDTIDIHSDAVLGDPAFGAILALERTEADAVVSARPGLFVADRDRGRPEAAARALLSFPGLVGPLARAHAALDAASRRAFGVDFPISLNSLALRVALFHEYRAVSRRMLRATRAKRFIAAWNDQVMFAAAKDLGLQTVELQHAAFSRYNLHYHFPNRGPVPYFADHFLTFGQHWIDTVDLPVNTRAAVVGSGNIARLRAEPSIRQRRRVVAASQGPTYWPLFQSVLEAAALAPDWEFIFRPHPREDLADYRAQMARRQGKPGNLRLSEPGEDVYTLIRTAEVQIGVASTTLAEGLALGCRTIVFQAPGSEAMEAMVRANDAASASTPEEIVMRLRTTPEPSDVGRYYAAPISASELLALS
jgi:hypothetical protein